MKSNTSCRMKTRSQSAAIASDKNNNCKSVANIAKNSIYRTHNNKENYCDNSFDGIEAMIYNTNDFDEFEIHNEYTEAIDRQRRLNSIWSKRFNGSTKLNQSMLDAHNNISSISGKL